MHVIPWGDNMNMIEIRIRKIDNGLLVSTEYDYETSQKYNLKDSELYAMDLTHALEIAGDRLEEVAENADPHGELPF
jgi:hypothetical protein